jgi:hypothetical protein
MHIRSAKDMLGIWGFLRFKAYIIFCEAIISKRVFENFSLLKKKRLIEDLKI